MRRPPRDTRDVKLRQKAASTTYYRKSEASKVPRATPIPPTPPILPKTSAPSIPSMPSTPSTRRDQVDDIAIENGFMQSPALNSLFQKIEDKTMGCTQCTQQQLTVGLS
jgi:hypothetical protein